MPETEQFRAIATAMLDRRIRNMRRLDEKTWIDTSLITHAEYQLFLDDMYSQDKYYQPDHWIERRFPPSEAQMPILGIRPSDAENFCEWFSEYGWGTFRLCKEDETITLSEDKLRYWQRSYQGKWKCLEKFLVRDYVKKYYRSLTENFVEVRPLATEIGDKTFTDSFTRNMAFESLLALDIDQVFDTVAYLISEFKLGQANRLKHILIQAFQQRCVQDISLDNAISLANDIFLEFIDRNDHNNRVWIPAIEGILVISLSLQLLRIRREGLLPAFEGILIVREDTDHA